MATVSAHSSETQHSSCLSGRRDYHGWRGGTSVSSFETLLSASVLTFVDGMLHCGVDSRCVFL